MKRASTLAMREFCASAFPGKKLCATAKLPASHRQAASCNRAADTLLVNAPAAVLGSALARLAARLIEPEPRTLLLGADI